MRKMEFKMERTGLLEVGDILPVTEGKLPIFLLLYLRTGVSNVCKL